MLKMGNRREAENREKSLIPGASGETAKMMELGRFRARSGYRGTNGRRAKDLGGDPSVLVSESKVQKEGHFLSGEA